MAPEKKRLSEKVLDGSGTCLGMAVIVVIRRIGVSGRYDNLVAESVFGLLKRERVNRG